MAVFDKMPKTPVPDEIGKNAEVLAFQEDVHEIFPNAAPSRLARACGGVNPRTAQKWLAGTQMIPPDVIAFVAAQKALLAKSKFEDQLEALVDQHAVLDPEVRGAFIAKAYFRLLGIRIE